MGEAMDRRSRDNFAVRDVQLTKNAEEGVGAFTFTSRMKAQGTFIPEANRRVTGFDILRAAAYIGWHYKVGDC